MARTCKQGGGKAGDEKGCDVFKLCLLFPRHRETLRLQYREDESKKTASYEKYFLTGKFFWLKPRASFGPGSESVAPPLRRRSHVLLLIWPDDPAYRRLGVLVRF
jgi:hypothetical protein